MSYQRMMSSVALAMLEVMPIAFGVAPPAPSPTRSIVGDTSIWDTSRNGMNRVSPAFSPSSWLPTVVTTPPMLHTRAGEFDGPQRSLYVGFDSASAWMYGLIGVPVER